MPVKTIDKKISQFATLYYTLIHIEKFQIFYPLAVYSILLWVSASKVLFEYFYRTHTNITALSGQICLRSFEIDTLAANVWVLIYFLWLQFIFSEHMTLTCISLIALLLMRSQSVSVVFPFAACPASTEVPPFKTPPNSADGHGPHRGCQTAKMREINHNNQTLSVLANASASALCTWKWISMDKEERTWPIGHVKTLFFQLTIFQYSDNFA